MWSVFILVCHFDLVNSFAQLILVLQVIEGVVCLLPFFSTPGLLCASGDCYFFSSSHVIQILINLPPNVTLDACKSRNVVKV